MRENKIQTPGFLNSHCLHCVSPLFSTANSPLRYVCMRSFNFTPQMMSINQMHQLHQSYFLFFFLFLDFMHLIAREQLSQKCGHLSSLSFSYPHLLTSTPLRHLYTYHPSSINIKTLIKEENHGPEIPPPNRARTMAHPSPRSQPFHHQPRSLDSRLPSHEANAGHHLQTPLGPYIR